MTPQAKILIVLSLLAAPSTLDRVYDFEPDAFGQIIDTAQRSAPLLHDGLYLVPKVIE